MRNPYLITHPCIISFSGGRTSAYMLKNIIDAHGGTLPEYIQVAFANTGKEMPETLAFVKACSDQWQVNIIWLECRVRRGDEGENKYVYQTVVVDYETASRNGEPFHQLILARRYAPNPVARFCTQELKILRIKDWGNDYFNNTDWDDVVGIRYDEPRRVAKFLKRKDVVLPLNQAKVTKNDISLFWKTQPFDLQLPNNNGVTDWGNCDLCFLKGMKKKLSIIRERPDLANWWEDQETLLSDEVGTGAYFRNDHPSYKDMKIIASTQQALPMADDFTIPCFCGD